MKRTTFAFFSIVLTIVFAIPTKSYANTCIAGSFMQVLNTTCTIGNVSYSFGPFFDAYYEHNVVGVSVTNTPISASDISFNPFVSGNQSGFTISGLQQVSSDFLGGVAEAGTIDFYYTVNAIPGTYITGMEVGDVKTLTTDAAPISFSPFSFGVLQGDQCFTVPGCVTAGTYENVFNRNGVIMTDDSYPFPSSTSFGESNGYAGMPGANGFFMGEDTYNGGTAWVQSGTMSFTSAIPEPSTKILLLGTGLVVVFTRIGLPRNSPWEANRIPFKTKKKPVKSISTGVLKLP
jgi:hypothetical protein